MLSNPESALFPYHKKREEQHTKLRSQLNQQPNRMNRPNPH